MCGYICETSLTNLTHIHFSSGVPVGWVGLVVQRDRLRDKGRKREREAGGEWVIKYWTDRQTDKQGDRQTERGRGKQKWNIKEKHEKSVTDHTVRLYRYYLKSYTMHKCYVNFQM